MTEQGTFVRIGRGHPFAGEEGTVVGETHDGSLVVRVLGGASVRVPVGQIDGVRASPPPKARSRVKGNKTLEFFTAMVSLDDRGLGRITVDDDLEIVSAQRSASLLRVVFARRVDPDA